jgi:hypothetical protein
MGLFLFLKFDVIIKYCTKIALQYSKNRILGASTQQPANQPFYEKI